MKNTLKLASLSLIMSVISATGAHAAASVRSFGGAGVYDSAASASATTASAPRTVRATTGSTAGRAGSLRATPSANRAGTVVQKTTSNNAGRAASMPRLSVGSRLNGAVVSGGSSNRPDNGVDSPGAADALGLKNLAYEDYVHEGLVQEGDPLETAAEMGAAFQEVLDEEKDWILGRSADGFTYFEVVSK